MYIFKKVVNLDQNWTLKMIFNFDNEYPAKIRKESSLHYVSKNQLLDSFEN